ncbi:MAG: chromosome segregation protein SMC [Planctomycetota bacterium]
MQFKRIELFGFKSFADKTSLDFAEGISAILGPNGCGKSNIVDAVKWVLGEQSAKTLRGAEMADLIFSGSEQRRPLGFAEASLYFDNSDGLLPTDYNEVCVTRRLYRTGESEYLLNRQRCRLRDVRELFLDTGIGTSAYSVIEQGKVEALLAARPQDRRQVFEEAAGISRYKARRKESLARLERTRNYLDRVTDIVEEVEKRIRSLARQAQSARRFERLSEELGRLRAEIYTLRSRLESERLERIRSRSEEMESLRRSEELRAAGLATAITALQGEELDLEAGLSNAQGRLQALRQELAAMETEQARLSERQSALEHEAAGSDERARAFRARQAELVGERAALEAHRLEMSAQAERLAKEAGAAQEALASVEGSISALEASLNDSRAAWTAVTLEQNALASARARLESENKSLWERRESPAERSDGLQREATKSAAEATGLKARSRELALAEGRLQQELSASRQASEEAREREARRVQECAGLESERASLASRLATLEELEASLSGFYPGVRALLLGRKEGRRECAEVEGSVADLFTVRPDLAPAIETALGGAQQYLLARTARGARDAIQYLKQEQAGRATLLPLDRIRPRPRLEKAVKSLPGVLGEALDLVAFPEAYRPAAEYLLAGILVVDTLDRALELRRDHAVEARMVTLEGDLVNPAGAMTGGRDAQARGGLLTRKGERETLPGRIAVLEQALLEKKTARDAAHAEVLRLALQTADREAQLSRCVREAREVNALLSARLAALSQMEEEVGLIDAEEKRIAARLQALEEECAALATQAEPVALRAEKIASAIEAEAARLAEVRAEQTLATQRVMAGQVRLAEVRQSLESSTGRLADVEQDMAERLAEAEASEQGAHSAREEHARLAAEEAALKNRIQASLQQCQAGEEESDSFRRRLGNLRPRLEEKRSEERATNKRLGEIVDGANALKLDERECTLRLETLEQKVREELGLEGLSALPGFLARIRSEEGEERAEEEESGESPEPDGGAGIEADELNPDALSAKIAEIQEALRRIGPVNQQAVSELAELRARREFLAAERDDLEAARRDLEALLERLNGECKRRFDETFSAVRENFHLMFRRLFGGGRADLVLEAAEDPLEAGIEIVARPPGKELTSISLLSGGEKALCAVALLFSLFQHRPSPFCILDEVDGPLDDSNIDLFMETVRDFAQGSQFIIITHNQRTMARADRIWGITQRERGVSIVYTLHFAEARQEDEAAWSVA